MYATINESYIYDSYNYHIVKVREKDIGISKLKKAMKDKNIPLNIDNQEILINAYAQNMLIVSANNFVISYIMELINHNKKG